MNFDFFKRNKTKFAVVALAAVAAVVVALSLSTSAYKTKYNKEVVKNEQRIGLTDTVYANVCIISYDTVRVRDTVYITKAEARKMKKLAKKQN